MTASHTINNLFLSSIHSCWYHPRILISEAQSQNPIELVASVNDFQQKQKIWLRFLLLFDNERTHAAIYRYQVKTDYAIIYLDHICRSCSCFTHLYKLKIISKDNLVIPIAFVNGIFCLNQFDFCKYLS